MDQVLDRMELPLSGVEVELVSSPVGLLRWRLRSADAFSDVLDHPLERTPILGWRQGTTSVEGRRPPVPFTVAWGSLLGGRGPLRVVLVRRRRFRATVQRNLDPMTLGGAFWITETEGLFEQLVVSDGTIVESRDLGPGPTAARRPPSTRREA
ncbi:hypothetical protein [Frankia sp. Cas3]|uniref:hypothetical protein n=1 Tax=Frankia sp. Cas3 TaxID=3073926 RepID=UPI002AD5268B|nr:hypothetical protein [Frankia sp. Cas3]